MEEQSTVNCCLNTILDILFLQKQCMCVLENTQKNYYNFNFYYITINYFQYNYTSDAMPILYSYLQIR